MFDESNEDNKDFIDSLIQANINPERLKT